jgi:hypothetical protein
MKTRLEEIINECKRDAIGHNCIECICSKGECLESLLDIYNSKFSREKEEE